MGILDWISESAKKLKDVEGRIAEDSADIREVYQRNAALEREIAQRTQELHLANQTLLTLEQVWDMMNSSRPLSNVLETIVSSLYKEFGYVYSFIAQKQYEDNSTNYILKTYLENEFSTPLSSLSTDNIFDFKLYPKAESLIEQAVKTKQIKYYTNIRQFIDENIKCADNIKIEDFCENCAAKAVIIFPINVQDQFKGFLCVFSPRDELKDDELSFLNLFSRQTELAITIANLFETVKKQAVTDHLTNLFNRRFFEDALHREATRSLRTKQPFCLIGIDLDYLKRINDTYGHLMGDKAISTIAQVIQNSSRSVDIPSRYGGEEFFIILPGIDIKGGLIMAERLRNTIQEAKIDGLEEGITASLGLSCFIEQTTNIDELFEMCDKAMYVSKQKGRNRLTLADTTNLVSWQNVAIDAFVDILTQHRIPFNKKLANDLLEKLSLKQQDTTGASAQEMLFGVVDAISKSYLPLYQDGSTKNKVSLAVLIAKRLNLAKSDIDKLKIAMLLYDIGNTMVPKDLMKKSAPLNQNEIKKIQKHPVLGAQEILKPINSISNIIPIIEDHHENWDGTGYPNNKKGAQIPITSQIILIVDSYFAMISYRPYRKPLSDEEAIKEIIASSGKKYSADLVDAFVYAIDEFKKL